MERPHLENEKKHCCIRYCPAFSATNGFPLALKSAQKDTGNTTKDSNLQVWIKSDFYAAWLGVCKGHFLQRTLQYWSSTKPPNVIIITADDTKMGKDLKI